MITNLKSGGNLAIDALMLHAQECYRVAAIYRVTGQHGPADMVVGWAKRAEYRAAQIEMGHPDPEEKNDL